MNRVARIAVHEKVQAARAHLAANLDPTVDRIIAVQQIPSPTFAEGERARYVAAEFARMGLVDVHQDPIHNVFGRWPAAPSDDGPPVVVSAHLDTVFGPETDLTVTRNGRRVTGPGIGDNSAGVAGLLTLVDCLRQADLRGARDIWLVANVGEEGLGNLRGMRAVVERFGDEARYVVVEGGLFGQIFHRAIGVRRYQVDVRAPGGHSWGSFGAPSAIHALGRIIARIDELVVPSSPRTTYNVGVIEGGTSVNSIAESARMLLDLRSETREGLAALEAAVDECLAAAVQSPEVLVTMSEIGYRPPGHIARDSPLVTWAADALRLVGCEQPDFVTGSTDANVPLSRGLAAVCVGLGNGGNAHRLDEYLDVTHLGAGLEQLLLLALAAARFTP